jgi:hypothetical protein
MWETWRTFEYSTWSLLCQVHLEHRFVYKGELPVVSDISYPAWVASAVVLCSLWWNDANVFPILSGGTFLEAPHLTFSVLLARPLCLLLRHGHWRMQKSRIVPIW